MMTPTRKRRYSAPDIMTPRKTPRRASVSKKNTASTVKRIKVAGNRKGSDHNDRATMSAYHSRSQKVTKIPDSVIYRDALSFNRGEMKVIRNVTLTQKLANTPGVYAECDRGYEIQLFTPAQLKSIEGIMFNNKTANLDTLNTPTDATVGTGANLPTFQPLIVHDARASFRLKNVSQHKTTVELFFFHGKGSKNSAAEAPWNAYNRAVLNQWRGMTNAMLSYITMDNTMLESPEFNKLWHTERIVFKMEPGEEGFYIKQGPKKYVMHGKDHVSATTTASAENITPAWQTPSYYGNGCYVMFRILNDLTFVTSTAGDGNHNLTGNPKAGVEHPINRLAVQATEQAQPPFGGVAVEMVQYYSLACPDKTLSDNYTTPFKYLYRQRLTFTGTKADIQVDADNSAVIPSTPS